MKLLLLLVVIQSPTLSISPRVVSVGESIKLTCRVPRHPDNRMVAWGVENWTRTERALEGESSPAVWEQTIQNAPCGVEDAFCEVTSTSQKVNRVTTTFIVAGCLE